MNTRKFTTLTQVDTLKDRVFDALLDSIISGQLAVGEALIEDDLASQLGVSRIPVREAIQQLTFEGFVDKVSGRSARVHEPTVEEINDVFDARKLIEGECARRAAKRISEAQLDEMRALLARGNDAVERQDSDELLTLNDQFHSIIIEASGNQVLQQMMTMLSKRIQWYFARVVVPRSRNSWQQHQEIYERLAAGDGRGVAKLMRDHVGASHKSLQSVSAPKSDRVTE